MTTTALRRAGGSLIVTVPAAFIRQNRLKADSPVELHVSGAVLTVRARPRRVTLADILRAAPRGAKKLRAPGWDEMAPAGKER